MEREKYADFTDDAEIVAAVIAGDERAIRYVFFEGFNKMLRVSYNQCSGGMPVPRDVPMHELFLYMTENDCAILRKYKQGQALDVWLATFSKEFFNTYCRDKTVSALIAGDNRATSYVFFEKNERELRDIFSQYRTRLCKIIDMDVAELQHIRTEEYEDIVVSLVEYLQKIDREKLLKINPRKPFSSWFAQEIFNKYLKRKERETIVSALKAGGNRATSYVFFEKYEVMLRNIYSQYRTGLRDEEFEDIVISLFEQLQENDWQKLRTYDPEREFPNWLATVFRHKLIDIYRKKGKKCNNLSDYSDEQRIYDIQEAHAEWERTEYNELLSEIKKKLDKILPGYKPKRHKEIIEALYVRGIDEETLKDELAKKYNIKRESADKNIKRATTELVEKHFSNYKK